MLVPSDAIRLSAAIALLSTTGLTHLFLRRPLVLFDGKSEFNGRIIVTEEQGERTLRFSPDGAKQSVIRTRKPLELALPYTRTAMVALALVPEPRRVLIVGLGGGAMAMFLRGLYPELEIDGVDIDPKVVAVAQQHLGLKPDAKLRAIVAEGRQFTENAKPGYDLIFLDAYGDSDPPRHLMTIEFLSAVRGKLSPSGIAVGNVWGQSDNSAYPDVVRTWKAAFDTLCVLDVPDATNTIFLARGDGQPTVPSPTALAQRAGALTKARALSFDLEAHARGGCLPQSEGGQVLRDTD